MVKSHLPLARNNGVPDYVPGAGSGAVGGRAPGEFENRTRPITLSKELLPKRTNTAKPEMSALPTIPVQPQLKIHRSQIQEHSNKTWGDSDVELNGTQTTASRFQAIREHFESSIEPGTSNEFENPTMDFVEQETRPKRKFHFTKSTNDSSLKGEDSPSNTSPPQKLVKERQKNSIRNSNVYLDSEETISVEEGTEDQILEDPRNSKGTVDLE